ncbi:uncharacterized protein LOC111332605 [Stylophora pistillata]|uniref:uncharacterized protein LOC111332605 n=1 Tax=Stylophora pistillata TaxID=50429 RepID=UPI000C03EA90|nr:uncharacterized protein LOC111332605 [Stylophora pistillata]
MILSDDQKRWVVFGVALNKVLVVHIRPFVKQEIHREYGNLQTSHNIHTQSYNGQLQKHTVTLRYENINGNDTLPRKPGGKYDYPKFDYQVTSCIDFAKLYVEKHMGKFDAFDEQCDASAVLTLLGKVPVFSVAVQSAAGDVKQARNAWAHCEFRTILCMNATVDPDLVKAVQQELIGLKNDVDKLAFEKEEEREQLQTALQNAVGHQKELEKRVSKVEREQCRRREK